MIAHQKRVVKILHAFSQEVLVKKSHDRVYDILFEDEVIAARRLNDLLDAENKEMPEEYWVAAYEALITGHYAEAMPIVTSAIEALGSRRPSVRSYPLVIIGFLRGANWCYSHGGEHPNKEFVDAFPNLLAKLVKNYSYSSMSEQFELPSTWLIGQFSAEINTYLSAEIAEVRWHRAAEICKTLSTVTVIGPSAAKFMAEITGRLTYRLSAVEQLKMVTKHYLNDPGSRSCVFARVK